MIYIIAFIFLMLDVISKIIISNVLVLGETKEIITNFFYLTYTHNYGAAWSIFNGYTFLIIIVSVLIIIAILYYLKKYKVNSMLLKIGYAILLGGSIGNLVDRIVHGYVIDFFDFYILGYDFPIFNIADTGIVVGIIIIMLYPTKKEKYNDNKCN